MKPLLPLILVTCAVSLALAAGAADVYPRTIFSDDFSSAGFGKRWGHYKSASEVKDGVLVGITKEDSDHNAVDHIVIEPERDLEVSVKFRYVSDQAKGFNVWLDDKGYKGSHAGHICSVTVTPTAVSVADAKTGNFRNDIYEKRKSPAGLSAEEKAELQTKAKNFPGKLALQDWHTLVVRTKGDTVEVNIDGKLAGTFQSEGIAHETKTLVSLTTNRVDVQYDDFSIKGAAKP